MLRLWRKWIIYPLFWLILMALVAGGIALFRAQKAESLLTGTESNLTLKKSLIFKEKM